MHKKINVLKIDSFKENSVSTIHRLLTSCSIDDLYAGKTPLICWSIKYDDMSLLDLLLKSGANANTFQDTDLFLYAIKQKNEEAARMLLRYGASQIVNDANGKTSLEYAASAGLCGLMDALLSNYDQQTKNKALFAAVQNESFEAVEILLASGADLECRDSSGNTPLIAASNQTNEEVVSFMLKNGAKVNAANLYGETALHASAEFCSNKNITRYLLNRGADVNATTESGATALMYALDYEFSLAHDSYVHQVSYTLLERGADPDAPTTLGISPLLCLRMTDFEDGFGHRHGLLDTLLSFGANIQIQDSEGRNVIDYFLETEDEEALQIIADHIRERKTLRNLYDRIKPYDRKADAVFPNANLNKESALKKLGYSTSLSEFKRKELLKRTAIPQLGLSVVARHLAYLISRTQARKDSANYEQALNIWKADLLWLNREYSYTEDLAKYLNR